MGYNYFMRDELYEIFEKASKTKVNPETFNQKTTREELFGYVLRQIRFNIRIGEQFLLRDLFKSEFCIRSLA